LEKKLLKDIIIFQTVVMVLFSVVLFFVVNRSFSLGFFIGSLLATINFVALIFVITKIFLGEPKTQLLYGFLFVVKLSLLGGIIFWLFKTSLFKLNVLGFIIGISTLFLVITISSILSKRENVQEKENVNIGVI